MFEDHGGNCRQPLQDYTEIMRRIRLLVIDLVLFVGGGLP